MPVADPPSRFGRRKLLWGAGLASLGVAGGSVVYRTLWGKRPPATGMQRLTSEEVATVLALAEVYFPKDPTMPSIHALDVAGRFDRYVAGLPGDLGRLTQLLLRSFEWFSVTGSSHLSRFSRLPLDARTRIVDAWEGSTLYPRRMAFLTLKLAVGQAYLDDDAVREAAGWYRVCQTIPREEWL